MSKGERNDLRKSSTRAFGSRKGIRRIIVWGEGIRTRIKWGYGGRIGFATGMTRNDTSKSASLKKKDLGLNRSPTPHILLLCTVTKNLPPLANHIPCSSAEREVAVGDRGPDKRGFDIFLCRVLGFSL